MSGDNLAILLFFLTCALALGVETVRAETTLRRLGFGLISAACLLTGVFWLQIKNLSPIVTGWITVVATNPTNWFVVIMFLLAVIAFHRPKTHTQPLPILRPPAPTEEADAPASTLPSTPTVPPASAPAPSPIKEEKREFIEITPEYLLSVRRQENISRVQGDRILAPYIGKWMKVTGTIGQIYPRLTWLKVGKSENFGNVILAVATDQIERFHLLTLNQTITVVGKLSEVNYGEIELQNCEIVDS